MRIANLELTEFPLAILDYSLGNYCRLLLFQRYTQKVVRVTLIVKGIFSDLCKRSHGRTVCVSLNYHHSRLPYRESELSHFCLMATVCLAKKTGQDSVWACLHYFTEVFVWSRACMTAQILVTVLTLSCATCRVKAVH